MMLAYPEYKGVEEYEPAREIVEGIYDIVARFEQYEVNCFILVY